MKPYSPYLDQRSSKSHVLYLLGETDNKKPRDASGQKKEDQLSHLNVDLILPQSPAPSGSQDLMGLLSRDNSMASVVSAAVPPDTQKFLKFAGKWNLVEQNRSRFKLPLDWLEKVHIQSGAVSPEALSLWRCSFCIHQHVTRNKFQKNKNDDCCQEAEPRIQM